MLLFTPLDGEETRLGALHGGSLHVLPLTWLAPPWVALPMYCCHPIAPPNPDPLVTCQLTGQQAAICSTEQTNKNKKTLKPYDLRRISANHTCPSVSPPTFKFPMTSKMTVCSHRTQHGSTQRDCDFPDEPLPRAGPKARTWERSRSSTRPAVWSYRVPP